MNGGVAGETLIAEIGLQFVFDVEDVNGGVEDKFTQENLNVVLISRIIFRKLDLINKGENSVLVTLLVNGSIHGNENVASLNVGSMSHCVVHKKDIGHMNFGVITKWELVGCGLDEGIKAVVGGILDGRADLLLKGIDQIVREMVDNPGFDLSQDTVKLEMELSDMESDVVDLEVKSVGVEGEDVETKFRVGSVNSESLLDLNDQINDAFTLEFDLKVIGNKVDIAIFEVSLRVIVLNTRIGDGNVLEDDVVVAEARERNILDSSNYEIKESILHFVNCALGDGHSCGRQLS